MLEWTRDSLHRYLAGDDGPVVMLNLLRFRPNGGRERYASYVENTARASRKFGVRLVYYGECGSPLVPSGEQWDAVMLVRYPSRQAFADMVADPDYLAGVHHRTEALLDSVLQPTVPMTP